MRAIRCSLCLLFILAIAGPVAAVDPVARPGLTVEQGETHYRIWVETTTSTGEVQRVLLRETTAEPVVGATGWDPAGRAAFANWTEAGRRWSSYSRDAGSTWSPARPLNVSLRLHDGATVPGQAMPAPGQGLALPQSGEVFLVQLRTLSLPEWRDAIEAAGGELLAVFPHNAHIVRMARSLTATVASLDFVDRVEAYHPSYRLEHELKAWISGTPDPRETEAGDLRVRAVSFEWGPTAKTRIADAVQAIGGRVARYWPDGHLIELWVNREQLKSIAAHDDVMWVDRWGPPETDMDLVREDSGANWIEANLAGSPCGQGVRGEVMDGGTETTHQDFDGILVHGSNTSSGHGTNTYGIVFGNGDRDGDGDGTATGHLPCAQGIAADFDFLSNRFAHTQELKGAPWFASFQTNSWGDARTTAYTSVSQQMDDIIWRLDIAILQSQSNAGNQQSRPQAWAKNIISVGGIRHFNTLDPSDDAWNSGASIGPAADGRIKPDINYWYDSIRTTSTGNGYTSTFGGTSAATPESAGVLGLMVQMWADNVWGTNPQGSTVFERQPHFSTIKALTINNAKQYPFSGTGSDLTRVHQGWGRPNAQIAAERAGNSFIVDEDAPLTLGQVSSYPILVPAGETELKVTMIYPDPPGTTSSTLHRINDVDLRVVSPSSVLYHGNFGLDANNYSLSGGAPNTVDTVENVFVENPEAGLWTVEVEAMEVNQDGHLATSETDVAYALVVTGGQLDPGVCGNGAKEGFEECDGADLGGATCESVFCPGGGTLTCNLDCTLNTSQCIDCPVCGDAACEPGEDCDTCAADCRSGDGFACGNGVCEAFHGEDCVSCPEDCDGKLNGKPDNRYCCSSGSGVEYAIDCNDSRCITGGFSCNQFQQADSCCGNGTCEGDEDNANCEVDCGPPPVCGDGLCNGSEDQCNCPDDCGIPPATETSCTDNVDNDCDEAVDCDDGDCEGDQACVCTLGQRGDPCAFNQDCCSNKCSGGPGRATCK